MSKSKLFKPAQDALKIWDDSAVPLFDKTIDQQPPSLSVYPAAPRDTPAPALLICPGGGYACKADHEATDIAQFFSAQGFSCFVLDYRVAPYCYPCSFLDIRRAVQYLRFHAQTLHIRKESIGVVGFSAGGHLAATASTLWHRKGLPLVNDALDDICPRPDFSVLCYSVIDLEGPHAHHGSADNVLGQDASQTSRKDLSLIQYVDKNTPPAFLWHTASDKDVPVSGSLAYAQALEQQGTPFALHIFPFGRHGLGLKDEVLGVTKWGDLCVDWIRTITM